MTARQRRDLAEGRQAAINQCTVPKLPVADNCAFFTCPKCGSQSISYYQFQMLASDEPITNICLCVDCGQEWKE
jgi:DNA-directed RNA polymerase subunit M/transcription elongation factor TFIIS